MKHSKYELETIVSFNEAEALATISTRSPHWRRRLDKLAEENPGEVTVAFLPDGYREYTFPKKWVRVVHPPRYSEEERQRRRGRMTAYHERRRTRATQDHADDEYLDYPPPPHTDADCPTEPYADFYCPCGDSSP